MPRFDKPCCWRCGSKKNVRQCIECWNNYCAPHRENHHCPKVTTLSEKPKCHVVRVSVPNLVRSLRARDHAK